MSKTEAMVYTLQAQLLEAKGRIAELEAMVKEYDEDRSREQGNWGEACVEVVKLKQQIERMKCCGNCGLLAKECRASECIENARWQPKKEAGE